MRHRLLCTGLCGWVIFALAGCRARSSAAPRDDENAPTPSSSAAAAASALLPVASAYLEAAMNPAREKPYSGPIGAIRGVVRATGDRPPELPEVLKKIPAGKCEDARAFYGKLFREGPGRELGDVLVAVTKYKGFVPAKSDAKVVVARGCAFESRTIAMTFGQRLEIKNRSGETFIPLLVGTPQAALVVAFPGGEAVKLFPTHPGEFLLQDQTHDFATAHVFVLKFPTAAVTGLDGVFEIKDIPVGDVRVSALLPTTGEQVSSDVKVVSGETTTVNLTIPFDAAAHAEPAPSAAVP